MFKELLDKNRYSFHEEFETWEKAVEAACKPLVEEGAILDEYVDSIVKSINTHGPYIVIAPNICIPHAQEGGKGVNETAISFMRTKKPVHFSDEPEHDAQLFFVLASKDSEQHLNNLTSLVELISDEERVNKLLKAESIEDLRVLI